MAEPTVQKLIRLSIRQSEAIDKLAETENVSVAEIIRRAIDAFIEQEAHNEQQ